MAGAQGARQGGPAGVRRAHARRLDGLPDLHVDAAVPDLARANPSRCARVGAASAAAGKRLWVFARERQDGRRVFSGISVLLERRRVLSVCARATGRRLARGDRRVRGADVRAGAVPLHHARRAIFDADAGWRRHLGGRHISSRRRACGGAEDACARLVDLSTHVPRAVVGRHVLNAQVSTLKSQPSNAEQAR